MAHIIRVALFILGAWCLASIVVGLALGRLAQQNERGWR